MPNGVDVTAFSPQGPRAVAFPPYSVVVGFSGSLKHGLDVAVAPYPPMNDFYFSRRWTRKG